jgi:hemerythrin-like domain-containing protein
MSIDRDKEHAMKFEVPTALQQEHEALHDELRGATQAGGEVGDAAKALARLMHPHFLKEDQIALPPRGLLARLARGDRDAAMDAVLALTDRLEAELPAMLDEHRAIVGALARLRAAAERAARDDIVAFARRLEQHARIEEEVMYPAARLVGRHVRLLGTQRAEPARSALGA